jgi:hypothetical protein
MNDGEIWTTAHHGVEIQLWRAGDRWFACAPGQDCNGNGHASLRGALKAAHLFIDAVANSITPITFLSPATAIGRSNLTIKAKSA